MVYKQGEYERRGGNYPGCQVTRKYKALYDFDEVEADHLAPKSKDAKIISENCKMRCAECNRRKNDI